MALQHRLLSWMQRSTRSGQRGGNIFHGPHHLALHGMRQFDATVHRLRAQLAAHFFTHHHGTSAAVALVAAFFGSGAVQVFAQYFQQRSVDINSGEAHYPAVAQKLQGLSRHSDKHTLAPSKVSAWQTPDCN